MVTEVGGNQDQLLYPKPRGQSDSSNAAKVSRIKRSGNILKIISMLVCLRTPFLENLPTRSECYLYSF